MLSCFQPLHLKTNYNCKRSISFILYERLSFLSKKFLMLEIKTLEELKSNNELALSFLINLKLFYILILHQMEQIYLNKIMF